MRSSGLPPAPLVLSLLIFSTGHYAAESDLTDTYSELREPFSGDRSTGGFQVTVPSRSETPVGSEISPVSEMPASGEPSSETDYDYSEEYDDNEPQLPGYVVDDSIRVEQVIKPPRNKTESGKTSNKPKRKKKGGKNGKNKKNRKKKTPCDAEFQNFCIHGKCIYIENLSVVTCICHQDYFGERCGEKSMKTQKVIGGDLSKIALAAVVAFVFAMSLAPVVIVITAQIRKRYFSTCDEETEERKKLRQENNAHTIV
ncbi:amphiregulin [Tenrec ecaudatus]|uniref:amphiregulin n=1 Tax=Tenrec ecaudatus TaxID=94439 RepID=UPI003F595D03